MMAEEPIVGRELGETEQGNSGHLEVIFKGRLYGVTPQ
jgi:hypothetical protein